MGPPWGKMCYVHLEGGKISWERGLPVEARRVQDTVNIINV